MSQNQMYDPVRERNAALAENFNCATANEWIDRAATTPDPVELFYQLWYENEVACLFADTNMGKSILAVQIAETIARTGRKVLYFDFEMTSKQFQLRYTAEDGKLFRFADNFVRLELSQTADIESTADFVDAIRVMAEKHQAKVVIIDNITWLCNRCEEGDSAGQLMQALVELKRSAGLSVLVLAHTPKRGEGEALTQNSLAGSKRLANFMDSIFAIGRDCTDAMGNARYIKQIKVRSSQESYGENNVIRTLITKQSDGLLEFEDMGFGCERELIKRPHQSRSPYANLSEQIKNMAAEGKTVRQIADELGISKSATGRILRG